MKHFRIGIITSLLAFATAANSQSGFSEHSKIFINVCLQHAPALNQSEIAQSAANEKFNARGTLAGAGVAVREGQSCNLRIGGGGTTFAAPSDEEVQRLAVWYARRTSGEVRRKRSAIGGAVWYEVRVGRHKYGLEVHSDKGAVSYWISKR